MIEKDLLLFLFGGLFISIIILIFVIIRQNKNLQKYHQNELNDLLAHQQTFKQELEKSLVDVRINVYENLMNFNERLNTATSNCLSEIENRLNRNLANNYDQTEKIIVNINEKMAKISESQNTLKEISKDIVSLQSILNDKKTRGTFGEIELYTILDNVFGNNAARYQKQYKLSNGAIADAVIFLNDSHEKIVVDSKFPLENFNNIYRDGISKSEQDTARNQFARDVKKHIDDIAYKYLIPNETSEVAYMFVPSEAVFAEIYGQHQSVVDYSYQKHVYIVSPTTLMAYLTVIKSLMLEQQKDANVKEIQNEFIKLGAEFKRYKERYDKISVEFERIYKEFNDLSITSAKLIKRFDAINQLDIEGDNDEGIFEEN